MLANIASWLRCEKTHTNDKGWMVLLSICILYIEYIPTDKFMQHKCMTLYIYFSFIIINSQSLSLTHFNSVVCIKVYILHYWERSFMSLWFTTLSFCPVLESVQWTPKQRHTKYILYLFAKLETRCDRASSMALDLVFYDGYLIWMLISYPHT